MHSLSEQSFSSALDQSKSESADECTADEEVEAGNGWPKLFGVHDDVDVNGSFCPNVFSSPKSKVKISETNEKTQNE